MGSLANIAPMLAVISTAKLEVDRLMAEATPELRRKAESVIACAMRLTSDVGVAAPVAENPVVVAAEKNVVKQYNAAREAVIKDNNRIVKDIRIFATEEGLRSDKAQKRIGELYSVLKNNPLRNAVNAVTDAANNILKYRNERIGSLCRSEVNAACGLIPVRFVNLFADQLLTLVFTEEKNYNRELARVANSNKRLIKGALRAIHIQKVVDVSVGVREMTALIRKIGTTRDALWGIKTFIYENEIDNIVARIKKSRDHADIAQYAKLTQAHDDAIRLQNTAVAKLIATEEIRAKSLERLTQIYLEVGGGAESKIKAYKDAEREWHSVIDNALVDDAMDRYSSRQFPLNRMFKAIVSMKKVAGPDGGQHPLVLGVVGMVARMIQVFECVSRRRVRDHFQIEVGYAQKIVRRALFTADAANLAIDNNSMIVDVLSRVREVAVGLPQLEQTKASVTDDNGGAVVKEDTRYQQLNQNEMERFSELPRFRGWEKTNAEPLVVDVIANAFKHASSNKKKIPSVALQPFGRDDGAVLSDTKPPSFTSLEGALSVIESQKKILWSTENVLRIAYTIATKPVGERWEEYDKLCAENSRLASWVEDTFPPEHNIERDTGDEEVVSQWANQCALQHTAVLATAQATVLVQRLIELHISERALVAIVGSADVAVVPLSMISQKAGGGEGVAMATITNAIRYFDDPASQWSLERGVNPRVPETYHAWWLSKAMSTITGNVRHGPKKRIEAYNMHRVLLALMLRSDAAPFERERKKLLVSEKETKKIEIWKRPSSTSSGDGRSELKPAIPPPSAPGGGDWPVLQPAAPHTSASGGGVGKGEGVPCLFGARPTVRPVSGGAVVPKKNVPKPFVPKESFMHSAVLAERWFFGGVSIPYNASVYKKVGAGVSDYKRFSEMPNILNKHRTSVDRRNCDPSVGANFAWFKNDGLYFSTHAKAKTNQEWSGLMREVIGFSDTEFLRWVAPGGQRARVLHPYEEGAPVPYFWASDFARDPTFGVPHETGYMSFGSRAIVDPTKGGSRSFVRAAIEFFDTKIDELVAEDIVLAGSGATGDAVDAKRKSIEDKREELARKLKKLKRIESSLSERWLPSFDDYNEIRVIMRANGVLFWKEQQEKEKEFDRKGDVRQANIYKTQTLEEVEKLLDVSDQPAELGAAIFAFSKRARQADIANRRDRVNDLIGKTLITSAWNEEEDTLDCLSHVPSRGVSIIDDAPPARIRSTLNRRHALFIGQTTVTASNNSDAFVLEQQDLTGEGNVPVFKLACVPRVAGIGGDKWHELFKSLNTTNIHGRSVVIRCDDKKTPRPTLHGVAPDHKHLPVECGNAGNIKVIWPGVDTIGMIAKRSPASGIPSPRCDALGFSLENPAIVTMAKSWDPEWERPFATDGSFVHPMHNRAVPKESKLVFCTVDHLFHLVAHAISPPDPVGVVLEGKESIAVTRNWSAYANPWQPDSVREGKVKTDKATPEMILGNDYFKRNFSASEAHGVLGYWATFPRVPKAHAMTMVRTPMPLAPVRGLPSEKSAVHTAWKNELLKRALPLDSGHGTAHDTANMSHLKQLSDEEAESAFRYAVAASLRPLVNTRIRVPSKDWSVQPLPPKGAFGLFGARPSKTTVPLGIVPPAHVVGGTKLLDEERKDSKNTVLNDGVSLKKGDIIETMLEWCGGPVFRSPSTLSSPLVFNNFGRNNKDAWELGHGIVKERAIAPPEAQMAMALQLRPVYWKREAFDVPLRGMRTIDVTNTSLVTPIAPGEDGLVIVRSGAMSVLPSATVMFCNDDVQETKSDFVGGRDGVLFTALQQFAVLAWTLDRDATKVPESMVLSVGKIMDAHAFTGGADARTHAELLKELVKGSALGIGCASVVLTAATMVQTIMVMRLGGSEEDVSPATQSCLRVVLNATDVWKSSGYDATVGQALAKNPPQLEFWNKDREDSMIQASNSARKAHALFEGINVALEAIQTSLMGDKLEETDPLVLVIDAIRTFVLCGLQFWAATSKLTAANWNLPDERHSQLSQRTTQELLEEFWPSEPVRVFVHSVNKLSLEFIRQANKNASKSMEPFVFDATPIENAKRAAIDAMKAIDEINFREIKTPVPLKEDSAGTTEEWLASIRAVFTKRAALRTRACLSEDMVHSHGNYNDPIIVPDTLPDEHGIDPACFFVPIWHPEHARSFSFVMLLTAPDGEAMKLLTPQQAKRLYILLVVDDTPHATLWRARFMTHFNTLSVTDTVSVVPQHTYRMKKDDDEFTLFANPYMYAPLQTVAERAALQKKGADLA